MSGHYAQDFAFVKKLIDKVKKNIYESDEKNRSKYLIIMSIVFVLCMVLLVFDVLLQRPILCSHVKRAILGNGIQRKL